MPILRHAKLMTPSTTAKNMTCEDKKDKMALYKEHYQAARVKKRLEGIEQRLIDIEKLLAAILARDEKKVKKKQKKSK